MSLAVPAAAAAAQAPVPLPAAHPVADAQGGGPVVIGKVAKITGEAWIIHNGQKIPAKAEMGVAQGDSVETAQGAEISLVFADRTTFTLKDKGLVGLDEFSYDPATKTGKESFLVAQGGFSFVSGDIAKTQPDAARIATPVMTMGIRGTTVAGSVGEGGETSVALLPDPGSNFVGEVAIGKTGGGGDVVTINSAGSGIVGATANSTFTVSTNAAAAVAASAPAAVASPSAPPALPAAPAASPTGPTGGATGTGTGTAAAAGTGQTGQGQGNTSGTGDGSATGPITVTVDTSPKSGDGGTKDGKTGTDDGGIGFGGDGKGGDGKGGDGIGIGNGGGNIARDQNYRPDVVGSVTLTAGTTNVASTFTLQSLMSNASDRDNDILRVVGLTADHGTIVISNGTVVLTPDANYTGTVTLSYQVADIKSSTPDSATIDFQAAANSAPTITGTINATASDQAGVSNGSVTATDANAGDTLTYNLVGGTALDATHDYKTTTHGTITLDTTTGVYTFTPDASAANLGQGATASDTATVSVSDGHGGTDTATITVDLTGTNDAPTNSGAVTASAVTTGTYSTISIASLVANASDVDTGDSLTISAITATNGTATISGANIIYDPNGFTGSETFSYTISDGHGGTVAGSANLTVNAATALTQTGTVLQSNSAQTLTDTDFSGYSGATMLSMYSGAGTQSVTLGANAIATGITKVNASGATGAVTIDASALSSNLTLTGGSGDDVLYGGSGADSLLGGLGNDTIHGASGDTVINGGGGTGDVFVIDGTNFEDRIYDDTHISGIETISIANATSPNQWFKVDDQTEGFTINITSSTNVTVQGSQGIDIINGGNGNEYLFGYSGNDTIAGGAGNNTINGDTGTDTATYADRSASVTLTNAASAVSVVHDTSNTDTLTNVEVVKGSDYADSFITDASGALTLDGGLGSDTYTLNTNALAAGDLISDSGASGTDTLVVGAGTFDLSAGTITGIEVMSLNASGSTVSLGGGADPQQLKTIVGGAGTDVIKLYNSGTSLDLTGVTLTSIESISTGTGNDSVSFDDISSGGVSLVVDGDASSGDSDTATFYLQTGGGTLDISGVVTSNIEHVVLQAAADTVENAAYTGLNLTMIGNNSGNTIIGGDGNDTLTGGTGADLIKGGDGNNLISGGGGQDTVSYADRTSGITATLSSSSISVSHDTSKTDTITYAEVVEGTTYADTFQTNGSASATIKGGGGADSFVLTGSPGANLTLEASGGDSSLSLLVSGRSANSLVRDIKWSGSDVLYTMDGGGTVTVTGNSVDTITSSDGNSMLVVAAGGASGTDDYMVVGTATDTTLAGNTGDDMLVWHAGSIATLDGGTGNDIADFRDTSQSMVVNLLSQGGSAVIGGSTTVTLSGIDHIQTGSGNDTISAGLGTTWIQAGGGNNQLTGYSGTAYVSYEDHQSSVVVDLGNSTAVHGSGIDTLAGISGVKGSDFNDTIYGSVGNDTIFSSAGDDTLYGYSGANTLDFSSDPSKAVVDLGNGTATDGWGGFDTLNQMNVIIGSKYGDTITGGSGADTLTGGIGADTLTGAGGSDVFVYTDSAQSLDAVGSRDTITDFVTGTDHLQISLSGAHVDVSGFQSVGNYNTGQAGLAGGGVVGDGFYSSLDDALYIYVNGNSTDIATDGGYVIGSANSINATDLDFSITGTSGNDTLVAGAGYDTMYGGLGTDTLTAGSGTSTMTGGGGADDFRFTASGGVATVTDYSSGTDTLTLNHSEFGMGSSGNLSAASYAETNSGAFGSAQNLGTGAGIVAVQNGTDVELWKTSDLSNASTANSHQFATLSNVNTSALDQTNFNLAV